VAKAAVCTDPQVTRTILRQGSNAEVSKSIVNLIIANASILNSAQTFVCSYPDCAVGCLQYCPHKIIYESISSRVLRGRPWSEMEYTSSIGTNPQRALPVTEHIPDVRAMHLRKLERYCFAAHEVEKMRGCNP
jgi:hypothetical protein